MHIKNINNQYDFNQLSKVFSHLLIHLNKLFYITCLMYTFIRYLKLFAILKWCFQLQTPNIFYSFACEHLLCQFVRQYFINPISYCLDL